MDWFESSAKDAAELWPKVPYKRVAVVLELGA
jgi:hypothetical protein